MLKALELVGFKSFADKTRFDFPEGITVVVGPNGSGKSNIVDAIKWVLGEQSAKSLRGQEMADVIFKGASAGNRRAMNTAEATLVFDNSTAQFDVDAPEVHVTRRVYRSGEGEYLINGQPSRLRDIRDLFRGTGAGAGAYSLIEQGKVDVLLAASPHQRRAIFEEAAGISRFKAKKSECARRLERVDQNLVRLADIVDEVDSRLRGVKSQAGKARKYKEYTERLQHLRTQVGHADWHDLSLRLQQAESQANSIRDEALAEATQAEKLEADALQIEATIETIRESTQDHDARAAHVRELIASGISTADSERRRSLELEDALSIHRRHLGRLGARAGDLAVQLQETDRLVVAAETDFSVVSDRVHTAEQQLAELNRQMSQTRSDTDAQREQHRELLNQIGVVSKNLNAAESQHTTAESAAEQCAERLRQLHPAHQEHSTAVNDLATQIKTLTEQRNSHQVLLDNTKYHLSSNRQNLRQKQQDSLQLQGEIASCSERANVLQEMEQRLEGVNAGAKEILRRSREATSGPFTDVIGLVADLIHVNVDAAPMVEVALGDLAHYVVLQGHSLLDQLRTGGLQLKGRVGFLSSDDPLTRDATLDTRLAGKPGVLGRADQFVASSGPLDTLVQQLLGQTWFVEDLDHALRLAQDLPAPRRLVTRTGDLLDTDGSLVVGSRQTTSGVISRRSELRALREKLITLKQSHQQTELEITQFDQLIRDGDAHQVEQQTKLEELVRAVDEHQLRFDTNSQRLHQIVADQQSVAAEQTEYLQQRDAALQQVTTLQNNMLQMESQVTDIEQSLTTLERQIETLEEQCQRSTKNVTEAKVELAKSEQSLESHRAAFAQYQREQDERQRTMAELQRQLEADQMRQLEAERNILATSSELASVFLEKEAVVREVAAFVDQRQNLSRERSEIVRHSVQSRQQVRELEQQLHQNELEADRVRHERENLASRLRDEYEIELSEINESTTVEEEKLREEIDQEILELRRRINNIGAVNMHALAELEDLDARHSTLKQQHDDLLEAKESLEKIVRKINADSRKLFTETLDAIRSNFQVLFRKTFGGGRADIVLEEGVDILESGIDIVATPPGKNSLGLSLLSGGERALTAVTLLLAIFQYRPSPFCVLDEVDGPLDEANIERFTGVLKEFLNWTKFVVVTHSKKTMTSATTLYGVTMQESGISKRVSVRFDDVGEDGQISEQAVAAGNDDDDDNERGAA
ncbi:MAG: chromosome segregation protein SMC [Pirellulaceae bacterium]|nr:chromosome segregation protein SMC [Pirellulaceae bacterium]